MRTAAAEHHGIRSHRGILLGDRYELRSVIASGGMGRVWRASDTLLERPVAVKVLDSGYTGDAAFLTRFRYEARHAALLSDPNIATVHDYGEGIDADGEAVAYLVMELVEGETVASLRRRELVLDVASTMSIVRQTASALAAAHEAGVVHRDVKPANVLVRPDGVVKLTDFGIAWSAANVPLTREGQVMGTVHYLAPERVDGHRAGPASDVYSLGVIAYECLSGRRPFDGDNSVHTALKHVRETAPPLPADLPEDVRALVARAMTRDPADRYPDGAALRDAVDALSQDALEPSAEPTPDRHPTIVLAADAVAEAVADVDRTALFDGEAVADVEQQSTPEPARRRGLLAAAVVLVFALLVGGALALAGRSETTAQESALSTTGASSSPAGPTPIGLAAEELVGLPVDEVQARLTGLGLVAQLQPAETTDVPAEQVMAVDPVGDVVAGQLITVTYAVAPAVAPTPARSAPVETAAPSDPATATPTASSPAERPGRGNGRSNGGNGDNGDN